jgi:ubiquitin conjugation factor E4 A
MCDNIQSNPFAGLFSTDNDAVSFSSQHHAIVDESSNINYVEQSSDTIKDQSKNMESRNLDDEVDQLMAHVFGLTLRRDKNNPSERSLVFIDADSIEHAVFERLMLPNPKPEWTYDNAINIDGHIVQTQVIIYLYECYCRLKQYRIQNDLKNTIRNACQVILRNTSTALQEPDLFQYQEVFF